MKSNVTPLLLIAIGFAPAAMAAGTAPIAAEPGGIDQPNASAANSIAEFGVAQNRPGGTIPPGVAAQLNNRPLPVTGRPFVPTGPATPNGGPFHWNEGEGPMHAPPGGGTVPIPLPSPIGLAVTGLLAACAIHRRRALG